MVPQPWGDPQELEQWKLQAQQGLSGDGAAALQNTRKQDRKLIQSLERELRRKEKALAETAGLMQKMHVNFS